VRRLKLILATDSQGSDALGLKLLGDGEEIVECSGRGELVVVEDLLVIPKDIRAVDVDWYS
jgi:hypothetical protein